MIKNENNFAFIDGQNLYLGSKDSGIDLDYQKFRIYLREKFGVSKAFLFLGYISGNNKLYKYLKSCGYILIFKRILLQKNKLKLKGNIDVHLSFYLKKNKSKFSKVVIVTSDGNFDSLVEYFDRRNKLVAVISPKENKCSILLKRSAQDKIFYLEKIKDKIS